MAPFDTTLSFLSALTGLVLCFGLNPREGEGEAGEGEESSSAPVPLQRGTGPLHCSSHPTSK